jgi:hypothetical protein
MKKSLLAALTAFAVLAVIAAVTLEGPFRIAILVLFAGLALKCWIATKRDQ